MKPYIQKISETFDEKSNPDNYEKGQYDSLENAEDSLLNSSSYPESEYELDIEKVKSFLLTSHTNLVKEILKEVEGMKLKTPPFSIEENVTEGRNEAMQWGAKFGYVEALSDLKAKLEEMIK